jgi:outer membrane protein assembly factor BamB
LPSSSADAFHLLNKDFSINVKAFSEAVKKNKGIKTELEIRFSLGTILSSLVIKNGTIYFGSTDGNFYALQ